MLRVVTSTTSQVNKSFGTFLRHVNMYLGVLVLPIHVTFWFDYMLVD